MYDWEDYKDWNGDDDCCAGDKQQLVSETLSEDALEGVGAIAPSAPAKDLAANNAKVVTSLYAISDKQPLVSETQAADLLERVGAIAPSAPAAKVVT